MRRFACWSAAPLLILTTWVSLSRADSTDIFEFFGAEAKVVSASLEPQAIQRVPATVYVVSQDDIRASGAETLWDALRSVPGVDVIATKAHYGEVSIRGMNKPLSNRTLVLLDGKTVLNGYFDFVNWESIPVSIQEIDRIEIVEGPASALYGANALTGVINIITKRPEQLQGLHARLAADENGMRSGAFTAASAGPRLAYRASSTWHTGQRFEDDNLLSSEVAHAMGVVEFRPSPSTRVSVSGGLSNVNTQLSAGVIGSSFEDGMVGFLRADASRKDTRVRMFWNRGRTVMRGLNALSQPNLLYDAYDVNVEQTVPAGRRNSLVVGGSHRENTVRSRLFGPDRKEQELWALFLEDRWSPAPKLDVTASARFDHHPFAGNVLSPRGSVVFQPGPQHVLRASAGSAFRNPTLTENYVLFQTDSPNPGTDIPNPPYTTIRYAVLGNQALQAEKLILFELAHSGSFRRVRTTAVAFHYRLQDMITTSMTQNAASPPNFVVEQSFINDGAARAWGGELGVEAALSRVVTWIANYSYLSLTSDVAAGGIYRQSPRHKANGSLRYRDGGWAAGVSANWVDRTRWSSVFSPGPSATLRTVDDYALVNVSASRTFGGPLVGFTLGATGFNVADHRHYEILPGQNGEVIGRRIVLTLSYSF
jgi:outer membrane receptor for ferrienterochelin and colicin